MIAFLVVPDILTFAPRLRAGMITFLFWQIGCRARRCCRCEEIFSCVRNKNKVSSSFPTQSEGIILFPCSVFREESTLQYCEWGKIGIGGVRSLNFDRLQERDTVF